MYYAIGAALVIGGWLAQILGSPLLLASAHGALVDGAHLRAQALEVALGRLG